ncbi:ATP-binding protein [Leifsonia sp. NCR5]|uniref:ATP-binding protein n=1 Tax=Leifsonia sp. NCR5 TaxID=1978342 RepID=UPI000A197568|nr:DUF87 domain-containing protein [Leifsonia sp. NCR5]
MADPHTLTILGLAGADQDASAILDELSSDEPPARGHRGPSVPAGDDWLRISAFPPGTADRNSPFTTVLAAASGGLLSECTVMVQHTDASGVELFVSGGHPQLTGRIRLQLAPDCDAAPARPSAHWREWLGHGVRLRLQAETKADGRGAGDERPSLLERLSTVAGDWTVILSFRSVHQLEVRDAQRAAVRLAVVAADNLTSTRHEATTRTVTAVSAQWARVQLWLDAILGQLAEGGAGGLWKTAVWAFGSDPWTAQEVVAALRGAVPHDEGRRFIAYDAEVQAAAGDEPLSIVTSDEAAAMLRSPRRSTPGLAVRPAPPAARRPDGSGAALDLGAYWSTTVRAVIGLTDLEGHAFVTGTTGSGKTATLHRLLSEAWNRHRIPFLVLDPVKDEYSASAGLFDGGLQVLTGSELSLNLFAPGADGDQRAHVARVAQAFRGAFTMPSPTPYVVTQLFDQVTLQPGGPPGTELFDVRDAVDGLVDNLGYAQEAQSNIRASLLTRLNLLLSPTRAHRFAWPDSSMVDRLFNRPTVVTLADIVDDEERSFLVLLLALATWSRARSRRAPRNVEHLLVLEEAHRVLPEVRDDSDPERGSARSASAQLLSSMLAEVRSFGQQVIVVDQSPARVASDVVRNTNLKIVHRTVSADDQRVMAAAVGLAEHESSLFGSLARGQVVVSTRQEPAPQTIAVELARPARRTEGSASKTLAVARDAARWPCCDGVEPERHFRAWRAADRAEVPMSLFLLGCRAGESGDGEMLDDHVRALLGTAEREVGAPIDCLAWAGLRRLLVAERRAGILPSATAVTNQLTALFSIWADHSTPTTRSAKDHSVPRTGAAALCPDCGTPCRVRVPAAVWLRTSPRTGLGSLASANWRVELGGVEDWASAEAGRLSAWLGDAGSTRVLRCQVHQAVHRSRLSDDVAEQILRRAYRHQGRSRP